MGLTVNISGRVGQDPETRYSQGGMAITSFSVACEEYDRKAREKKTVWCRCILFGKVGERAAQVVKKGVVVELLAGKMNSRESDGGKVYTDYIFNDFTVLAFPARNDDCPEIPEDEVPF